MVKSLFSRLQILQCQTVAYTSASSRAGQALPFRESLDREGRAADSRPSSATLPALRRESVATDSPRVTDLGQTREVT